MVEIARQASYCHDAEGRAYAVIPVDGKGGQRRFETWPVRSAGFRSWLCHHYYLATRKAPPENAKQEALGVLEAQGKYDGDEREVFVRVGRDGANIVIDLADEPWRCVVVTSEGWTVQTVSPVLFRRPRGLLALPEPACGGKLDDLRPFLNVQEAHWPLIVGWLIASLFPGGPYPVCCLHGEQGSAKSTTARILRALIDPNKAPLRGTPRDERDLIISASNSWVLALDNLSTLTDRRSEWLSDALCRLSTGGGFSTRELYADAEEMIFDATRPVILTGIEDLAARPDLVDRALMFHLPEIDSRRRRTEATFWQRFQSEYPRILGAFLDVLAGALRHLPGVNLDNLPRMADFATRAVAACRALGWKDEDFLDAYRDNQEDAVSASLDHSILKQPLWACFKEKLSPWRVTWPELLAELTTKAGEKTTANQAWPKDTRRLAGMIKRMAPNMRKAGFDVDTNYRDKTADRERGVCFTWQEKTRKTQSSQSEPAVQEGGAPAGLDRLDRVLRDYSPPAPDDGHGDAYEGF
jgi:hypothetical protein